MSREETPEPQRFGTFGGVFTPSLLTILGVILFMRAGFVVGEAGIGGALLILGACEVIVLLTTFSIAAIATNTHVKGGGAYYLISRVLGPEFGGSIGITLFLAQAISIPFYILGFTEALTNTVPTLEPYSVWIAYGTAAALFAINFFGASWAIKAQYVIMGALAFSIFSLLAGAIARFDPETFRANWTSDYTPGHNLWTLLAIYFPAVTGIMTGVNMSGDLKDPARSLVRGTFGAIFVGGAVYALHMILCGGSQTRLELVTSPYETLLGNAFLGTWYFIAAGVFAATISSAVGSFLGAPRVLQSLARDHVFSILRPFAKVSGPNQEPRVALFLTGILTVLVIFPATQEGGASAFNVVASVVSMFFLVTYGIVNVAAFVESFGGNPSFRPRFRYFHWSTALLGALACLVVMFLISVVAAISAIVIIAALYYSIRRKALTSTFGDARRGFVYSAVTKNLQRLQSMPQHAKNWRPTIMILAGHPERRINLIRYGVWFEAQRGIVSVVQMIRGELSDLAARRKSVIESLTRSMKEQDLRVIPEVVISPDLDAGIGTVLQSHSLLPVKPNLVLLGWPREEDRVAPYFRHLRDIRSLGMSIVSIIDRGLPEFARGEPQRIDVWWRGKDNGSLMLILSHLLTQNWEWSDATIRILRMVGNEAGLVPARDALTALVEEARVEAEVRVLVSGSEFREILHNHSGDASVVILGFTLPDEEGDQARQTYDRLAGLLDGGPTTILVNSSGDADLMA